MEPVGTPARLVFYLGFALVIGLAVLGRHDGRAAGRPVHAAMRGDGVLEGRVALADDFVALRRRRCVPALPLRLIELDVVGIDGVGLEHGWLAWRASGQAQYERVVPVEAGHASIATCAEVVDVSPLIGGCAARSANGGPAVDAA